MDSFAIIVLMVIILSFVAVTLIMKLRYRLPWKGFFRSINDPDYNLLSIVHRRYAKVRAGKQTFERYRTEMLADYDAEHFQKEKYINCDWKTFYYALRNSFPEYIVVEERTFRQAEKERRNVKVSYEMTENARVETEIISHIEKGLNP